MCNVGDGLGVCSVSAAGQTSRQQRAGARGSDKFDVAVNFTYKVAKIASTTNRFVLPGGSLDAAYNFGGKARASAWSLTSMANRSPTSSQA